MQDLLALRDLSSAEVTHLLDLAQTIKQDPGPGKTIYRARVLPCYSKNHPCAPAPALLRVFTGSAVTAFTLMRRI